MEVASRDQPSKGAVGQEGLESEAKMEAGRFGKEILHRLGGSSERHGHDLVAEDEVVGDVVDRI